VVERIPAEPRALPGPGGSGRLVPVARGEPVPADGVVCRGAAAVDERRLAGWDAIVHRTPGDRVLAGSTVLDGWIEMVPTATGAGTRAAALKREVEAALASSAHPKAYTARAERAAAATVVPTFALAGAGLAVGGLGTAMAVMRPDYASGIGVADSFDRIRVISANLRAGALVRRPEALARLGSTREVLVCARSVSPSRLKVHRIDSRGSWTADALLGLAVRTGRYFGDAVAAAVQAADRGTEPGAAPVAFDEGVTFWDGHRTIRVVRERGAAGFHTLVVTARGSPLGRIDIRPDAGSAAADVVTALKRVRRVSVGFVGSDRAELRRAGCDFVVPDAGDEEVGDQVARWARAGRQIVFVGDLRSHPRTAAAAAVSVNLAGLDDPTAGDVVLLTRDWEALPGLWDEARRGRVRRAIALGMTWGPNAACVAAGFALGLPLVSVALSNFGTLAAYSWAHRTSRPQPALPALCPPGSGWDPARFSAPEVRAPPAGEEDGDHRRNGTDEPAGRDALQPA
jgi:cation transport ATPase